MADDLLRASRRFQELAEALEKDVNGFVAQIVTNVVREVVKRTPIDVGTARSNYVTRIGQPTALIRKAYSPFSSRYKGGIGGPFSDQSNLNAAVAQAQAALTRRKRDDPVYITNNLPYIGRLNDGYSRQAPKDFVRAGVQAGVKGAVRFYGFPHIRKVF